MEIKEALKKLREEKKRKFDQTLDLIINLKNLDLRKEALNTIVKLKHPINRKIAGFFTKKSSIIDTITEDDFKNYNDPKSIKKLAKSYDLFIASAPMMAKIASKFGRVLGPLNKMPNPQIGILTKEDEAEIKKVVESAKYILRVRNKEMSIKLPVGKESMPDQELLENIGSVMHDLEQKLPRGKDNIKNVLIKFTMTPPLRLDY